MKSLRKAGMAALVILGCCLALSLTLRGINYAIFHNQYPPRTLKTISDFKKWKPQYTNVTMVTVRGATYYKIHGGIARLLPSDVAVYSFDGHGNFIGWTIDIGDYRVPKIVFEESAQHQHVTIEEVTRLNEHK